MIQQPAPLPPAVQVHTVVVDYWKNFGKPAPTIQIAQRCALRAKELASLLGTMSDRGDLIRRRTPSGTTYAPKDSGYAGIA